MKKNNRLGIFLVLIGAFILLSRFSLFNFGGEFPLLILGLGFLGTYFVTKPNMLKGSIGFLIPGSILTMIWVFTFLENMIFFNLFDGGLFFICLGIAFLSIYIIHTSRISGLSFGEKNWPLIVSFILLGFGTLVSILEFFNSTILRFVLSNFWPVALIIAGLFIAFPNLKKKF